MDIAAIGVTLFAHYEMEALDAATTRLAFNVNWTDGKLPAENRQGLLAEQAANFERLKHVCETNPA